MIFRIEKWKIHFLHVVSTGLPWTCRPPRLQQVLLLLPKKATYVAKNFGCCKGRSKVSVDIFMASGDLLVAQKSQFLQKIVKKPEHRGTFFYPPPKKGDKSTFFCKSQKQHIFYTWYVSPSVIRCLWTHFQYWFDDGSPSSGPPAARKNFSHVKMPKMGIFGPQRE